MFVEFYYITLGNEFTEIYTSYMNQIETHKKYLYIECARIKNLYTIRNLL